MNVERGVWFNKSGFERQGLSRSPKGFTLLELLIVVAIIAILLSIGIPNYRNARIRGRVAAAHSNLKRVETALDWYASDHGAYPTTMSMHPRDPLALLANPQLRVLTTPVAYLNGGSLRDPFGVVESQINTPTLSSNNDFPKLVQPNEERSLLYFHYPSLAYRLGAPSISMNGSSAVSIGPDRKDSLGAYRPFGSDLFAANLTTYGFASPLDTVYSPTNGSASPGDIARFVGEARRFRIP